MLPSENLRAGNKTTNILVLLQMSSPPLPVHTDLFVFMQKQSMESRAVNLQTHITTV